MNHQIDTLECNLQLTEKTLHQPLQRQLMQYYDVGLFRVIDRVFQKFEKYDWEFEEIQLQVPPIAFHEFSKEYLVLVEKGLNEYLERYFDKLSMTERFKETRDKTLDVTSTSLSITEKRGSLVQVILEYLQKGYYSQVVQQSFGELWEIAMRQNTKELLQKLSQHATSKMIKRLVYQLSESQLQVVIQRKESSRELVSLVSQELLREIQSERFGRKSVLKNVLKTVNKEEAILDSDILEMLSFSEQKELLSTIQKQQNPNAITQQINRGEKAITSEDIRTTSEWVLHFLQFVAFPQESLRTSKPELDGLFESLFTSNHLAQWRKAYRQYHHKGKGIHTWVLEKYLSQEVHRVQYLIQLDSWVPLSKKATQSIKKGMQKKQNQYSDFAKELAENLLEEDIHHVVGYIEPEHKDTVLYFVEATVKVVEIQSLTDKMTNFKKALYGFVLSYLLLKQGYTFHKKQFVANQIQQLARHFGIEYNVLLQLFLETLNPDATFGKEKELYEILQVLQSTSLKINSEKEEFIESEEEVLTSPQSLTPEVWSRLFLFFLQEERFPKWSIISNFKDLVESIPIVSISEEKVLLFLNSQRIIQLFLDQSEVKKQGITSLVLLHCVLHKKVPEFVKNQMTKALEEKEEQAKKSSEMSSEIWTRIFLFYLELGKFPQWTKIQDVEELIASIPIEKTTKKELMSFFKSQKTIAEFLESPSAKEQRITNEDLMLLILNSTETNTKNKKKIHSSYWIKVWVYYLEKGVFPNRSFIQSLDELIQYIPIQSGTKENILTFLESQPLIVEFLNSEIAKQQDITLVDLCQFILHPKSAELETKLKRNPQKNLQNLKIQEEESTHWISIFMYYLQHQALPWWSHYTSLSSFLKQGKIDKEAQQKLTFFIQKHKNTLRIWRTLNEISKDKGFRVLLMQWFVPNAQQRDAITLLVNIFSPFQTDHEKAFAKHFGVLPNGALFWQFLWNSRQILFIGSEEKLAHFWKKIHQEYSVQSTVFNSATWELLKDKKGAKIWKNIIRNAVVQSIENRQESTISEGFIEELLFNTSKRISRVDQIKLKNGLSIAPEEFVQILQRVLTKKKLSKEKRAALFSFWVTMLFPRQKKQFDMLFKEFTALEKYVKMVASKDHDFILLFLWKAVTRFQFKSIHQYVESLLLEFAQYKRISFADLFVEFYGAIYQNRKLFPILYKSLVILKLKQGFEIAEDEMPILTKEDTVNKKEMERHEKLAKIQLSNAGIVLLWKFMPILFERTNLWSSEEKQFNSEEAKNKAIFLLHQLATGSTEYEDEHELLLLKLLCGLAPDFSVEEVTLQEEDTQLIENLLTAAIAQWKKLGTISIEGFRNTFLKRSGILDEKNEGMNIIIEPTGVDILLDFLPWTISNLRLPWLEKKIYVSWREK